MRTTDDWFAEPKPKESLNDLYDRRLVAWGWVTERGYCSWEAPKVGSFFSLLQNEYIALIKDQLNQPLLPGFLYGNDWRRNPEGPA